MKTLKLGIIKLVLLQIIQCLLDCIKIKLIAINLQKGDLESILIFKKKSKSMLILYPMPLQKKVKMKKLIVHKLRLQF